MSKNKRIREAEQRERRRLEALEREEIRGLGHPSRQGQPHSLAPILEEWLGQQGGDRK